MSQGSDVLFINISFANIHDVIKGTLQIITYTKFIFMFEGVVKGVQFSTKVGNVLESILCR